MPFNLVRQKFRCLGNRVSITTFLQELLGIMFLWRGEIAHSLSVQQSAACSLESLLGLTHAKLQNIPRGIVYHIIIWGCDLNHQRNFTRVKFFFFVSLLVLIVSSQVGCAFSFVDFSFSSP